MTCPCELDYFTPGKCFFFSDPEKCVLWWHRSNWRSSLTILSFEKHAVKAHAWARSEYDHYVEPNWCSSRLFDEEPFVGKIWDPAAGLGRIVESAIEHGYDTFKSDIQSGVNFFESSLRTDNIVTNPPFDQAERFFRHAVTLARGKIAMIFPTARLNAAHWVKDAPLRRVWLLTPRPSMPPVASILAGQKASGGKMDYCWLVWEKGDTATGEIRWLHRDRKKSGRCLVAAD